MDSVFLDADVLLDLYVDRQPHHDIALRLLTELKRHKTRCYTSAVVVANIYYLLAKIQNKQFALEKLRRLRKLVSIAPLTEAIIDAALSDPHKDFEDSIQLNCALNNGVGVLITRNIADYPKGRISLADPSQYLVGLPETNKR
jgi:predicted nucleic acid-binding protein